MTEINNQKQTENKRYAEKAESEKSKTNPESTEELRTQLLEQMWQEMRPEIEKLKKATGDGLRMAPLMDIFASKSHPDNIIEKVGDL